MIHTITAIHGESRFDCRTFGYFNTLESAQTAVANNTGSMQESYYSFIVIESLDEGIHPDASVKLWYSWTDDEWIPCDEPKRFEGMTNFAIG